MPWGVGYKGRGVFVGKAGGELNRLRVVLEPGILCLSLHGSLPALEIIS